MKSPAADQLFRKHGGEFHFAAQFLPAVKRDAMAALFAFCKLIVDATSDDTCGEKMAMVRARIHAVFAGEIELPRPEFRDPTQHVLAAFAQTVKKFQIPRQTVLDFVESKRMEQTVTRYATWNSLRKYCELSAGSIAIAASCIVGLTNPDARPRLVDFAVAIRLTQLLLNLQADLAAGRIYLPLEDLARCRVTQRALREGDASKVIEQEVKRARELLESGLASMPFLANDRARMSLATLVTTQRMILDTIARRSYAVPPKPIVLTMPQKLRALPLAWRVARSA